uniref:Uncharacterized protein n=1 Tax=Spodoptera littoralis nuclear polyhedrosis virus TaxID=10456 RepID=A0A3G4S8S5_NPVSL|nr:hypothetical protein [Spodoptera littoralis nucleopolyhedrovirus]
MSSTIAICNTSGDVNPPHIDSDYDTPEIEVSNGAAAAADTGAGAVAVTDGAAGVTVDGAAVDGAATAVDGAVDGAAVAATAVAVTVDGAAAAAAAADPGKLPAINYISDHKYNNLYIALNDCNNILYEFMELPTDLMRFITKTVVSNEHLFSDYNTIQLFLRSNVLDVINGRVYFANMSDNYKIRIFCQYIVQLYYLCFDKFDDDDCDVKTKLYAELDFIELIRLNKMFKFDGLELYDMALRHTIMVKDHNININCFNKFIANAIGIRKSVLYMAFSVPGYDNDTANNSEYTYDNKNYSMSIARYLFDNSFYYETDWSKRFNLNEPIYNNLSQFFAVFSKFNIDYRDFKTNNCLVKKLIVANVYILMHQKRYNDLYEEFNIIDAIKTATSRDEVISIVEKAAQDLKKFNFSIYNFSEILRSDSKYQTSDELIKNKQPFKFNYELSYALNDDQCNKMYSYLVSQLEKSSLLPNIHVKIYNLIKQFNIMSCEHFNDTVIIAKSWKRIYMHFKLFVNMFNWIDLEFVAYAINKVLDKKIAQLTICDEYDDNDEDDEYTAVLNNDANTTDYDSDTISPNVDDTPNVNDTPNVDDTPPNVNDTPNVDDTPNDQIEHVIAPISTLNAATEDVSFEERWAAIKSKYAETFKDCARIIDDYKDYAHKTFDSVRENIGRIEAHKVKTFDSVRESIGRIEAHKVNELTNISAPNVVVKRKRGAASSVSSKRARYGVKILPPRAAAKRL